MKRGRLLPALALTTACFVAADLLRDVRVREATAVSLVGWVLLLLGTLSWARAGRPRARFVRALARVGALAGVAAVVLLAYLVRSRLLDAGTHVDVVYTWIGLGWALALNNPITFVGSTPSYAQSPLMLLSHAPGMAVGFAALGALALHTGLALTVAALLAITTVAVAPRAPVWMQAAAVALAAGCISTRCFEQAYNAIGYTPVGVCLGLGFVAAVAVANVGPRHRLIGGLVALALLHYAYLGIAMAMPMSGAWLLLRRRPLRWMRVFVAENRILLLVLVLLAATLATHGDVLLQRLRDVAGSGVPLGTRLRAALTTDTRFLAPLLPAWWWWHRLGPSWLLIDLPPLGGPVLPALALMWACAWIVAPRGRRVTMHVALFLLGLGGLSVLQHVLAGPEDYRDFPLVVAASVAAIGFVLRAPALSGATAWIAWTVACVVAAVNFADVARLAGHRYETNDYAPREVAMLEAVRRMTARAPDDVGAARLLVVHEDFVVPVRALYLDAFTARGFTVTPISADAFCADRDAALREAIHTDCSAFLLAASSTVCDRDAWDRTDASEILRYEATCPADRDDAPARWSAVALPDGPRPTL